MFVNGGLLLDEIERIRDMLRRHPDADDMEVLVCTTGIVDRGDVLEQLFGHVL